MCSFAVLCIRHAAADQAAYNHEVLWSGSGTGHLPHCLPRGELPPTGPHLCHEHLLQVCCHHFPKSNKSWDHATILHCGQTQCGWTLALDINIGALLILCSCPVLQTCLSARCLWTCLLVKLGRGSVCVHHCCICWQACLCLTPPCQWLHLVMPSHSNMILLFMQGKQATASAGL